MPDLDITIIKTEVLDRGGMNTLIEAIFQIVENNYVRNTIYDTMYETQQIDINALKIAIGASTDTPDADGSLYARINALENNSGSSSSDITALEKAVGSSNDPANATGSLYARIAAVKNTADAAATKSSVDDLTARVTDKC